MPFAKPIIFFTLKVACIPILYLLFTLIVSGQLFYAFVGIAIIIAFYLLFKFAVGTTEISHGSTYGKQEGKKAQ
jgi:hypothetical protein